MRYYLKSDQSEITIAVKPEITDKMHVEDLITNTLKLFHKTKNKRLKSENKLIPAYLNLGKKIHDKKESQ